MEYGCLLSLVKFEDSLRLYRRIEQLLRRDLAFVTSTTKRHNVQLSEALTLVRRTLRKKDKRLLATKFVAALKNSAMTSLINIPLAVTDSSTGGMPGGRPGGTGCGAGGTGGITTTGGDKVVKA